MRDMILQAIKTKLLGEMNGHIANIEVMMTNPVGVGDHPTIVDTIVKELSSLDRDWETSGISTRSIRDT